MKRGQASISIIIFIVLGMFIFYILFVTPSERASLLQLDTNKVEEKDIEKEEPVNTIFEKEIGYIGKKTGSLIKEHSIDTMKLEYPPVEEIVWEKGTAVLTANVLFKGEMKTTIPGDYAFVSVSANVGEVIGTPRLEITSNDIILFTGEILKNQQINLKVNSAKIVGDSIEISCEWHGLIFWKQQKCELADLEIRKVSYNPINPTDTRQVTLSKKEGDGGSYKLYFEVNDAVNDANLRVNINGVQVFDEAPLNRSEPYSIRGSLGSVDFVEGENLIDFSIEPSASYELDNIKLNMYETVSEESNLTFYFNISDKIYTGSKSFLVIFNVEEISESGGLDIIFNNKEYWFAPSQIIVGENILNVKKEDLNIGANKMRIHSSTGRFRIGKMQMLWE